MSALLIFACGSVDDPTPDDVGGADWSFNFGDAAEQPDANGSEDVVLVQDTGGATSCGTTPLPFEFVREDGVLREDCMAASVCLARESTGPIFNAAQEEEPHRWGCESVSPLGTEWAPGACHANQGPFTTLRVAHDCESMSELGGKDFCVHIVEENLWFDVEFIEFNGGTIGGGFSYRRVLAGGNPCGVGAVCERIATGVECSCPPGTGGDPLTFCL